MSRGLFTAGDMPGSSASHATPRAEAPGALAAISPLDPFGTSDASLFSGISGSPSPSGCPAPRRQVAPHQQVRAGAHQTGSFDSSALCSSHHTKQAPRMATSSLSLSVSPRELEDAPGAAPATPPDRSQRADAEAAGASPTAAVAQVGWGEAPSVDLSLRSGEVVLMDPSSLSPMRPSGVSVLGPSPTTPTPTPGRTPRFAPGTPSHFPPPVAVSTPGGFNFPPSPVPSPRPSSPSLPSSGHSGCLPSLGALRISGDSSRISGAADSSDRISTAPPEPPTTGPSSPPPTAIPAAPRVAGGCADWPDPLAGQNQGRMEPPSPHPQAPSALPMARQTGRVMEAPPQPAGPPIGPWASWLTTSPSSAAAAATSGTFGSKPRDPGDVKRSDDPISARIVVGLSSGDHPITPLAQASLGVDSGAEGETPSAISLVGVTLPSLGEAALDADGSPRPTGTSHHATSHRHHHHARGSASPSAHPNGTSPVPTPPRQHRLAADAAPGMSTLAPISPLSSTTSPTTEAERGVPLRLPTRLGPLPSSSSADEQPPIPPLPSSSSATPPSSASPSLGARRGGGASSPEASSSPPVKSSHAAVSPATSTPPQTHTPQGTPRPLPAASFGAGGDRSTIDTPIPSPPRTQLPAARAPVEPSPGPPHPPREAIRGSTMAPAFQPSFGQPSLMRPQWASTPQLPGYPYPPQADQPSQSYLPFQPYPPPPYPPYQQPPQFFQQPAAGTPSPYPTPLYGPPPSLLTTPQHLLAGTFGPAPVGCAPATFFSAPVLLTPSLISREQPLWFGQLGAPVYLQPPAALSLHGGSAAIEYPVQPPVTTPSTQQPQGPSEQEPPFEPPALAAGTRLQPTQGTDQPLGGAIEPTSSLKVPALVQPEVARPGPPLSPALGPPQRSTSPLPQSRPRQGSLSPGPLGHVSGPAEHASAADKSRPSVEPLVVVAGPPAPSVASATSHGLHQGSGISGADATPEGDGKGRPVFLSVGSIGPPQSISIGHLRPAEPEIAALIRTQREREGLRASLATPQPSREPTIVPWWRRSYASGFHLPSTPPPPPELMGFRPQLRASSLGLSPPVSQAPETAPHHSPPSISRNPMASGATEGVGHLCDSSTRFLLHSSLAAQRMAALHRLLSGQTLHAVPRDDAQGSGAVGTAESSGQMPADPEKSGDTKSITDLE
ncbi:hypothetical protein PAPYR_7816 [Paratrimastix pyriformis]|uniref:Uncharacterized protein n=1 Tax=Paratrimastix pyriformis TaxID=342808 RepID=A0ABQ8UGR4_9EUKA|nr:hypothetical protein PAPYR_7816 [Paratrimastix pyriformis]